MIRRRRLIYNTALLTVSSLLMSCIGMAFQVWLVGRIGSVTVFLTVTERPDRRLRNITEPLILG